MRADRFMNLMGFLSRKIRRRIRQELPNLRDQETDLLKMYYRYRYWVAKQGEEDNRLSDWMSAREQLLQAADLDEASLAAGLRRVYGEDKNDKRGEVDERKAQPGGDNRGQVQGPDGRLLTEEDMLVMGMAGMTIEEYVDNIEKVDSFSFLTGSDGQAMAGRDGAADSEDDDEEPGLAGNGSDPDDDAYDEVEEYPMPDRHAEQWEKEAIFVCRRAIAVNRKKVAIARRVLDVGLKTGVLDQKTRQRIRKQRKEKAQKMIDSTELPPR